MHPNWKILVSAVEHPSVYELGDVFVPVESNGRVDVQKLEEMLDEHKDQISLVSIMAANNETGVVQPIDDIFGICKRANVLFHTDATQVYGKIATKVQADFITRSHNGGPKELVRWLSTKGPPLLKGGPQDVKVGQGQPMFYHWIWRSSKKAQIISYPTIYR